MHVVKGVEAAQRQKVQKPQLSSEAFWLAFGLLLLICCLLDEVRTAFFFFRPAVIIVLMT